jgi:Ca2+-dependent lipid-binding protein
MLCIIPISQNSQHVTKSLSLNFFSHSLQISDPISKSDNGFSHTSRQRTIVIFKRPALHLFLYMLSLFSLGLSKKYGREMSHLVIAYLLGHIIIDWLSMIISSYVCLVLYSFMLMLNYDIIIVC